MRIPLLLLMLFITSQSFGQSIKDQVVGHWAISFEGTLSHVSSAKYQKYDSLPDEMKAEMREKIASQRFDFESDGTFSTSLGGAEVYEGSWSINEVEQVLHLTYNQGGEFYQPIEDISPTKIILRIEGDESEAIFHLLQLNRN